MAAGGAIYLAIDRAILIVMLVLGYRTPPPHVEADYVIPGTKLLMNELLR